MFGLLLVVFGLVLAGSFIAYDHLTGRVQVAS